MGLRVFELQVRDRGDLNRFTMNCIKLFPKVKHEAGLVEPRA